MTIWEESLQKVFHGMGAQNRHFVAYRFFHFPIYRLYSKHIMSDFFLICCLSVLGEILLRKERAKLKTPNRKLHFSVRP